MKTIKIISHMARVSKLWLNVDFSSGHLRTNIAARLPIIPRLPMEGIRISSNLLDQVSRIFSGQEQLSAVTISDIFASVGVTFMRTTECRTEDW